MKRLHSPSRKPKAEGVGEGTVVEATGIAIVQGRGTRISEITMIDVMTTGGEGGTRIGEGIGITTTGGTIDMMIGGVTDMMTGGAIDMMKGKRKKNSINGMRPVEDASLCPSQGAFYVVNGFFVNYNCFLKFSMSFNRRRGRDY